MLFSMTDYEMEFNLNLNTLCRLLIEELVAWIIMWELQSNSYLFSVIAIYRSYLYTIKELSELQGPAEEGRWSFFIYNILILFWGAMRGQPLFNLTKSTLCITKLCNNTNWRQRVATEPAPHHSLLGNSVCWKWWCKMMELHRFIKVVF